MVAIRRLYIYLVCAVSISAVAGALVALLQGLIPPGKDLPVTSTALFIAVVVIGLPFYLLHWVWAQRLATQDADERNSLIRGLYLFGLLASFFSSIVWNAYDLIVGLIEAISHVTPQVEIYAPEPKPPFEMLVDAALGLVVFLVLWLYHELTIRKDMSAATGETMWQGLRRIYIYGFSAAGLAMLCIGATQLVRWLLYQIGSAVSAPSPALSDLIYDMARVFVGVALWGGFLVWAQRRFDKGLVGEQTSVVRKLYLYGVILVSSLGVVTALTMLLSGVLQNVLGLHPKGDIRDTLSVVFVLGIVWAHHTFILRNDMSVLTEAPRQATVRRVYFYLVATIGLSAFLIGLSGVASVLIRQLSGEFFGEALKVQLAWFTAALVAGLPVWLLPWWRAQLGARAPAPQGTEERRSFVRKLYLYWFVLVATMTVLGSAIYILFRILSVALGDPGKGNLLADLGQPIAFTLIAIGVWLYHGWILQQDGRAFRREKAERCAAYRMAIVDPDKGAFGKALLESLQRELPGVSPVLIGLTTAARQLLNVPAEQAAAAQLNDVALIVGPWTMMHAVVNGGSDNGAFAAALQTSSARKLLVPTYGEGWDWVGLDKRDAETLMSETAREVRQIVEGEERKPSRGTNVTLIVVLVLLGFCVLIPILTSLVALGFGRF